MLHSAPALRSFWPGEYNAWFEAEVRSVDEGEQMSLDASKPAEEQGVIDPTKFYCLLQCVAPTRRRLLFWTQAGGTVGRPLTRGPWPLLSGSYALCMPPRAQSAVILCCPGLPHQIGCHVFCVSTPVVHSRARPSCSAAMASRMATTLRRTI